MRESRFWVRVLLGCALLALLVWQGRHVAHLIPQAEAAVADLGVWGPVVYMLAVALLSPLLFPESLLGIVAGFVFGLGAGTLYLFVPIYLANLAIFALGRTWLRGTTLRLAEGLPQVHAILRSAQRDSTRLTLLIRLVPLNVAFVSYVLGAGRFPWRAILIGNFAALPHLFLPVYLGYVAKHAATATTRGGEPRALEDVGMLVGLLAWVQCRCGPVPLLPGVAAIRHRAGSERGNLATATRPDGSHAFPHRWHASCYEL